MVEPLIVGRPLSAVHSSRSSSPFSESGTLHGAEATFCKRLAQACETTAANTVAAAPKPELIHPGVMRYFREIGVTK